MNQDAVERNMELEVESALKGDDSLLCVADFEKNPVLLHLQ